MSLPDFISLSECLLGLPWQAPLPPLNALDPDLANFYMTQLVAAGTQLDPVLNAWVSIRSQNLPPAQQAALVQSQIISNSSLAPAAQQIILAWYTGFHPWFGGPPVPDPARYEQTLVWLLAQAHPMGVPLSFGYWQYAPGGAA